MASVEHLKALLKSHADGDDERFFAAAMQRAAHHPQTGEVRSDGPEGIACWSTLNSDTSRVFDKPRSGRIAVKVINNLGDEVMKVFRV